MPGEHGFDMGIALKAGIGYFALVFGVAFALGTTRVLLIAPILGNRTAELGELPIMLAIVFFSARWLVRRLAVPPDAGTRLLMGAFALALMLVFEFGFVLKLRGMTLQLYIDTFDPVSGSAFYAAQLLMALMPWLLSRLQNAKPGRG
jgi:hypothetical protein